jgi:phosphoglycolate phosphatase-like HAD superfamily hydrolase
MAIDPHAKLREFKPKHEFFVGFDSDGCVFDTMEIKHKECFIPNIINHWGLQAVSKYAREAAEFVNLYSRDRGVNRWPALIKVFDLLRERPEVQRRHSKIPQAPHIRKFIASGVALGEPALLHAIKETPAGEEKQELEKGYKWSRAVNDAIADMVHDVPPFPFVRESLERLSKKADIICVSQTPGEALVREWQEHDIAKYAAVIAGQEMGSKKEHLQHTAKGKYAKDHVLMVGDAEGDLKAARPNDALFFPVNPGHEEASWELFFNEAIERFFAGTYAGDYEKQLVEKFMTYLPENPPWKR